MADLLQDKRFSDFSEISSTQDKTIYFVGYEENGKNIKISDTNLLSGLDRIEEVDDSLKFHINDTSIHKTDEDINNLITNSNQVKTITVDTTNFNEEDVKNGDHFIIYSTSNLYLDTLLSNVQENCFVCCDVVNKSTSSISIYNSSTSTTKAIYKLKANNVLSAKISKIVDNENQTSLYKINVLEKEDLTMANLLSSSVPKNELRSGNVYYIYKNISSTQSIEYDVSNMSGGSFFRWQVGNTNFTDSSFYEISNNRIVNAIYSGGTANTRAILSSNSFDITAPSVTINGTNIIEPINSISTIQSDLTSHVNNGEIHKNIEQIKEIIDESKQIKALEVSSTNINTTDIENGDSFIIRTTSNLYLDTLLSNVQEDCFVYCDVINKTNSPISIYNSSISTSEPIYVLEQNSVFSTKVSKIIDESIYKIDILEKGKSAYQIWLDEGNSGTEADFIAALKGEKGTTGDPGPQGEPGESAYDIWVAQGGVGDEAAFLSSLKGDKGDTGPQGEPGADGSPGVIISVTGQLIDDLSSVNMGDEFVFSTDATIPIDYILNGITKQISVGWTVRNTGSATISVTKLGEEIASVDAGSSVSGKWIRTSDAVFISVFKRALGEGGSETKTPPYIEIDGDNIVIVGGESSTAAPQQLASFVPNVSFIKVEGVVDISYLAFNAKNITAQEDIDFDSSVITSANYAFSDSAITSMSHDWPSLIRAEYMYRRAESLESIAGSTFPLVQNGYAMFARTYNLSGVSDLEMLKLKDATYMFQYTGAKYVERCYFGCSSAPWMFENATSLQRVKETYFPNTTNATCIYNNCTSLSDVDVHFPKLSTINFMTGRSGGLGNVTTLENVTVLEGGLAACDAFLIANSTNLTDESIQNIIDALPDHSVAGTPALVGFPPDRLTTEQQTQLSNKGWTWSEDVS